LQEQLCDSISVTRCGQPAVIAEVALVKSARKKAFLTGAERAWIERGRAESDQSAVNEVADFDGSDRPLRYLPLRDHQAPSLRANHLNEDRATVAIDLTRPIAHAHTNRDAFAVAADVGAPVGLPANPARPAPVHATEDI
jgi:hypothetical protein